MKKSRFMFIAVAVISIAAWAGTTVTGYGNTRSDAAYNTEQKAKNLAKEKGTCYDYVAPENCKNDGDGWVCTTDVANHSGSCGGGKKVKP